MEFRTSDTKRFYANRNSLLVLLKNAHNLLLLLVPLQLGLLLLESLASLAMVRRWSFGKTQSNAQATDPAMDAIHEKIRRETDGERKPDNDLADRRRFQLARRPLPETPPIKGDGSHFCNPHDHM